MAEAETLIQRLLLSQRPDGGWSYNRGTSWAEPTAFAVLALQSAQDALIDRPVRPAVERGVGWLLSQQKPSGGWSPNASVSECTSVTSVAAMAILPSASVNLDSAVAWISGQVYTDDLSFALLLAKALHLPPAHAPGSVAWYPGTAGWVTPTALAALALLRIAQQKNRPPLRLLAAQCCSYLLGRRCVDNGWNHGGSKTRSEDAISYPETTGLAMLALRAAGVAHPSASVELAHRFASRPESLEGLSWIQMALQSPGQTVPDPKTMPVARTTRDVSLRLLTLSAQAGKNVLLSS